MRLIGLLAIPAAAALAVAGCTASGGGSDTSAPSNSSAARPADCRGSLCSTQTDLHLAIPTDTSTSPAHPPARSHPARSAASRTMPTFPNIPQPPGVLTVVLNPGHNGDDYAHPDEVNRLVPAGYGKVKACDTTGTDTNGGYAEHAFNWDVALRVRRILEEHGVHVIMTRHSDTGVGPCVDRRAAIGNEPGVDAVVSIHADGAPASGHGFHVNQDSRRPDGATAEVAHESIELGRAIHAALVRSSGLVPSTYIGTDGYYYRDDLAGLNLARRPATFLELGNMKNAGDAALQSSAAGRQQIAAAIAAGILAFLG